MTFMETWQFIWLSTYDLFDTELHFPAPIGDITALDMLMFWSIGIMLADAVSMVASRRD